MKSFTYGVDEPPEQRSDFVDEAINVPEFVESQPGSRLSTKAAYGQMTDNSWLPFNHRKGWVKQATASKHRQNERMWRREVLKAQRAGSGLPQEPPPTVGGFYAV